MKYIYLLFSVLILSCQSKKFDVAQEKILVDSTISQYHKTAAAADLDNYIGLMDSNAVFIGTDATEYWKTKDFEVFCKPYFEKKKSWDFHSLKRNIYFSNNGSVAWFDELLDTKLGLSRGSGVLERVGEKWKIKQYVLSMTIPNDYSKQVIELKKSADSLLVMGLTN
jgi:hypothetical protein